MTMRTIARKLIALLSGLPTGLTAEEKHFLADWEHKTIVDLGLRLTLAACVIMPLMTVLAYILAPDPHRYTQVATHFILSVMLLTWWPLYKHLKVPVRALFLMIQLTFATGYSRILYIAFTHDPDINDLVFLSTIYIATMIFTIVLCPYWNGLVVFCAALEVGLGMIAWRSNPVFAPWIWFGLAVTIAGGSIILCYSRVIRIRREALGELAIRRMLLQADRKRLATVEAELEQAREIQDSFSPHAEVVNGLGLTASFYHLKYDLLGGDWSAARALESGDFAVVVADANGKGVQAALVLHAIQTLWASSLAHKDFDPIKWLLSANQTLLALGQRKEHTLSLCILMFNQTRIRYYSAGHIPLFLVCGDQGRLDVIPVATHGMPLGLVPDPMLMPQEVDLTQLRFDSLLIGTDGVFDRGIRTRRRAVLSLIKELRESGAEALGQGPLLDDKLVVWLRKAA